MGGPRDWWDSANALTESRWFKGPFKAQTDGHSIEEVQLVADVVAAMHLARVTYFDWTVDTLTQRQLAERCGVAQRLVADIERGTTWPTTQTITRLVTGLDLAVTITLIGTEKRRWPPAALRGPEKQLLAHQPAPSAEPGSADLGPAEPGPVDVVASRRTPQVMPLSALERARRARMNGL